MKKLTAMICTTVMAAGMAMSALAAPSINQLIPEQPVVVEGDVPDDAQIIIEEVATENYADATVAEAVTAFNDETVTTTVEQTLETLGVDLTQEIRTTEDNVIDPTEYNRVMPFVDLVLDQNGTISFELEGEVTVTFTAEVAVDKNAEDLIIMQIDPDTGEVYFIEIHEENFNAETGEITATFPCLGPFTILDKSAVEE